ncbi:hypothetical protein GCM10027517_05180 [Phycicoccus ginsengisoli]
MPSWRPQWSLAQWPLARTWFLTVRLLEGAGALLVLGQVLDGITAWRQVAAFGPTSGDGTVGHLTFQQHVTVFAQNIVYRPVVLLSLFTALVVLGGVWVLLRVRPVEHARLLRWELLVLGLGQLVVALVGVGVSILTMFSTDPSEGSADPMTVTLWTGPGPVQQGLVGLAPSGATVVALVVAALWWARLPAEFEAEDRGAEGEAVADRVEAGDQLVAAAPADGFRDEVGKRRSAVAVETGAGHGAPTAEVERTPRRGRGPRSWRHEPAPDGDEIVLDGVEQIAPVERLTRRDEGDGSTGNGYETWLRRP